MKFEEIQKSENKTLAAEYKKLGVYPRNSRGAFTFI